MRLFLKKVAAIGFLVFLALWIVGAIRGMALPYPEPLPMSIASARESYVRQQSVNNLRQAGLAEKPLPMLLDGPNVDKIRIHEKRAILTTNTPDFEDDNAEIQAAIQSFQAEVFTYHKSDIEPNRRLVLEIGVQPDKFDDFIEKLHAVGSLASISVEQKDRTGEFRKLHAQRQSLKKNLEAIKKIREGKTLSLDDALRIEQRIQDLEQKIEDLGVQFGDLLGKESYYHVHITLVEYQHGDRRDRSYSAPQRFFHAFLWAGVWWCAVALAAGIIAATGVSAWVLRQKPAA